MRTIYFLFLMLSTTLMATDQAEVAGAWQVSWQVRLGTAHATVQLTQDGSKLSGTFEEMGVSSKLSGSVEGKNISFDVQFP
jgi:hypothetical protein